MIFNIIRFFQINQTQKGKISLLIVKNGGFTDLGMKMILQELQNYVGDTAVEVNYVDEIPLVRTGKRSRVISTVVEDFQKLDVSRQVRKLDDK